MTDDEFKHVKSQQKINRRSATINIRDVTYAALEIMVI